MRTSVTAPELEASSAVTRTEVSAPTAVPSQVVDPVGPAPMTSHQPAVRTPAALMGLDTLALATALVVRCCPPGHLRTALDALADPPAR